METLCPPPPALPHYPPSIYVLLPCLTSPPTIHLCPPPPALPHYPPSVYVLLPLPYLTTHHPFMSSSPCLTSSPTIHLCPPPPALPHYPPSSCNLIPIPYSHLSPFVSSSPSFTSLNTIPLRPPPHSLPHYPPSIYMLLHQFHYCSSHKAMFIISGCLVVRYAYVPSTHCMGNINLITVNNHINM